jgi:uncharacterized protein (DUF2236 family)
MLSTDPARAWLAEQIRSRVIGDQADAKTEAIMAAPGPRWFAPDSPVRLVHADASMFVGGLRALLLQSLHPLAMAGVNTAPNLAPSAVFSRNRTSTST